MPPPPPADRLSPQWLDEPAVPAAGTKYNIAVAAFADAKAARRFARVLKSKGFGPLRISSENRDAGGRYRVVLLGLRSRQTAERAARDARRQLAELLPPSP